MLSLYSIMTASAFSSSEIPSNGFMAYSQGEKIFNVAVTGAAGQIGYAFIPLLCTG